MLEVKLDSVSLDELEDKLNIEAVMRAIRGDVDVARLLDVAQGTIRELRKQLPVVPVTVVGE